MRTIQEQIVCVEREIGMRERVYPSWVRSGKMSQEKADHEIATMRDVLKTLEQLRDGHRAPAGADAAPGGLGLESILDLVRQHTHSSQFIIIERKVREAAK